MKIRSRREKPLKRSILLGLMLQLQGAAQEEFSYLIQKVRQKS
jgi:hypothetical protein